MKQPLPQFSHTSKLTNPHSFSFQGPSRVLGNLIFRACVTENGIRKVIRLGEADRNSVPTSRVYFWNKKVGETRNVALEC